MSKKDALRTLDALSHGTRLDIFRSLIKRGKLGLSAKDLCKNMSLPPATLSFHMAKLTDADIVDFKKDGRRITYFANVDGVKKLSKFLLEECCSEGKDTC